MESASLSSSPEIPRSALGGYSGSTAVSYSHTGLPYDPFYAHHHRPRPRITLFMMEPLELDELEGSTQFDEDRVCYVDNLRTTLAVALIIQHTITETAIPSPKSHFPALVAFVALCKTVLPGLFFFIAGHTTSISRGEASYLGEGRSDAEFLWRRTRRLLLPVVVYGSYGHVVLWMALTKCWPLVFGGIGSTSDPGYAKLQGPTVYLVFLYALDIANVAFRPSRTQHIAIARSTHLSPPSSPDPLQPQSAYQLWPLVVESTRDWYALATTMLGVVSLYTVAAAAGGRSDQSFLRLGFGLASYDPIVPAAPFQFILAYMAGTQFHRWKRYVVIPSPFLFPSLAFALVSSTLSLVLASAISPAFAEIFHFTSPSPIHPSFVDAGFNLHTVLFSLWTAYTFFSISATLFSVFAQSGWTKRDWGMVSQNSYIPIWVHMIPVLVFSRLLGAGDVGRPGVQPPDDVGWRCFLVATGSVICSWFIGFGLAGLSWVCGC